MTSEIPVQPTPEIQLKELAASAARDLASGKREEDVIKKLTSQGISTVLAAQIVEQVRPIVQKGKLMKYRNQMIGGIIWTVTGIAITIISMNMSSGGGTYYVCWGAVLFGVIDFLMGLFGWLKYRS